MGDYIRYFDFKAMKLGDLAYKLGDYKCAQDSYSKALKRLNHYQGDRMAPIMMAANLVRKINALKINKDKGKAILQFDLWKLSKSSFIKGEKCQKYLYLDKFIKAERTPVSPETQKAFDQGHNFEELVRETDFPGGINVKEVVGNFAYFNSYTRYLLDTEKPTFIYEATLIEDEVFVMCDVLKKTEDGRVAIYEIKLNTGINDAIINDLAIQYAVSKKRFGDSLHSFNLILREEGSEVKWTVQNLTDKLEALRLETEEKIQAFKKTLLGKQPKIAMGEHCHKPYPCEFIDYCMLKK